MEGAVVKLVSFDEQNLRWNLNSEIAFSQFDSFVGATSISWRLRDECLLTRWQSSESTNPESNNMIDFPTERFARQLFRTEETQSHSFWQTSMNAAIPRMKPGNGIRFDLLAHTQY